MTNPGFPIGGAPLTLLLFGENVCKTERIGSHWVEGTPAVPPGSASAYEFVNNVIVFILFVIDCEEEM